jgi:hypothetical protein
VLKTIEIFMTIIYERHRFEAIKYTVTIVLKNKIRQTGLFMIVN